MNIPITTKKIVQILNFKKREYETFSKEKIYVFLFPSNANFKREKREKKILKINFRSYIFMTNLTITQ